MFVAVAKSPIIAEQVVAIFMAATATVKPITR